MNIQQDFMQLNVLAKEWAQNTIATGAVEMLPDYISSQSNFVTRNLARGFYLYLADEAVEQVMTGDSNFTKMGTMEGWKNLLDSSVFYGLASAGVEATRVDVPLSNNLSRIVPNRTLSDAMTSGAILTVSKIAGKKLENSAWQGLKQMSRVIGL